MSKRTETKIEQFQNATDFTALGSETDNLAAGARCVTDAAAIKFDKVAGATVIAGWKKTIPAQSFKDLSPTDYVQWFTYLSALTNVDYVFVRMGTDATHYAEWRFHKEKMTAGKFTRCFAVRAEYDDFAISINWNAITWLAGGVAFDAGANTLADIAMDDLALFTGLAPTLEADLALQVQQVSGDVAPEESNQVGGKATAAAPTYVEGASGPLSMDLAGGLRTINDLVQGAVGDPAPDEVTVIGHVGITGVPTEVDSGDAVNEWHDTLGRQVDKTTDLSQNATRVNDIAPAKTAKLGPLAQTTLTAPGSTPWVNISKYDTFNWDIVIAAIDTDVTVRVEQSPDKVVISNSDDTETDTTYTTNGAKQLSKDGVSVKYNRLTFVSENGGTAVTVQGTLTAGN
jgi:hypothetical protein